MFTELTGGSGLSLNVLYYVFATSAYSFAVSTKKRGGTYIGIPTNYTRIKYIARAINYGDFSSISGAGHNSNTGSYCSISGVSAHSNNINHARIHGGGLGIRMIDVMLRGETTAGESVILTIDGQSETDTNVLKIPVGAIWIFTVNAIVRGVGGSCQSFTRRGLIQNTGSTTAISIVETIGTDHVIPGQASQNNTISITAVTATEQLRIAVQAIASTNSASWVANVNLTELDAAQMRFTGASNWT